MKTLFTIIFLLLTLNLSSNELDWVDEQINAIKPPRKGVKTYTISRLRDPFVFLKKKAKKNADKEKLQNIQAQGKVSSTKTDEFTTQSVAPQIKKGYFTLGAIMNRSAFINSKWYKLNDTINGYKLVKVESSFVVLTKSGKNILLSTNNKNPNIKFKNK